MDLLFAEVPTDGVNTTAEHSEVLKTRAVFAEARQSEQDPERALVRVDAKQRVLVLESSLPDQVERRVRQKFAVDRCHPRKHLHGKFVLHCNRVDRSRYVS